MNESRKEALIPKAVNFYNQYAKVFILNESETEKSNLLVFDPMKTKVSLKTVNNYEFESFFKEQAINSIKFPKNENELQELEDKLKNSIVQETLPIFCNILDIWLAVEEGNLKNRREKLDIQSLIFLLASCFVSPFFFYFKPNEQQIENVKRFIQIDEPLTISNFISTISKLLHPDVNDKINLAAITYTNSDHHTGVPDYFFIYISETKAKDLSSKFIQFVEKEIQTLYSTNSNLHKIFEEKLHTVDIYKLLAYISPLFLIFCNLSAQFDDENTEKFFNFAYLLSFNTLTNPVMHK